MMIIDKKYFIAFALLLSVSCFAEVNSSDFLKLHPTVRMVKEATSLPENPFEKFHNVTAEQVKSFEDKYNVLIADISEAKLTGLIWHSLPEDRMVMLGDTCIREGQIFPRWLAQDGDDFLIKEIALDYIRVEHLPNEAEFDIKISTRKSYSQILAEARPAKSSGNQKATIDANGEVVEATSPNDNTHVNGIYPKIKTFSKDAVAARRASEDQLFLLESE